MSVEIIQCPACQHELRIPDTLFGQTVRCPQCKAYFQAPIRDEAGQLGAAKLLPDVVPVGNAQPKQSTLVPGLALLLVGLMGMLVDGYVVFMSSVHPELLVQSALQAANDPNNPVAKMFPENIDADKRKELIEENIPQVRNVHIFFAAVSLFVGLGGLAILIQRFYWFAFFSCLAAMLNLGFGCCLFGLPAGIIGLIKLLDPDVKSQF